MKRLLLAFVLWSAPAYANGKHGIRCAKRRCEIDRTLFAVSLNDLDAISRTVRVVPSVKDGQANGFTLSSLQPGSIVARLGFRDGDTLRSINGLALKSIADAMMAFAQLRDSDDFEVLIERHGAPMILRVVVVGTKR